MNVLLVILQYHTDESAALAALENSAKAMSLEVFHMQPCKSSFSLTVKKTCSARLCV